MLSQYFPQPCFAWVGNGMQVLLLIFGTVLSSPTLADEWRLDNLLETPDWLHVSGSHRIRYEYLDNRYRAGRSGNDELLLWQTLFKTQLRFDAIDVTVELLDARQSLAHNDSSLSSGNVNTLDVLQAYLQHTHSDKHYSHAMKLGRFTMDVGSRRFIARNRFRNTINAFTGFDWLSVHDDSQMRVFYTMPVTRLPNQFDDLKDNKTQRDKENHHIRLLGVFVKNAFWSDIDDEWYYFDLDEQDYADIATSDRDLHTLGTRLFIPSRPSRFDMEVEVALQWGQSRASKSSSAIQDLDHFAYFAHLELGYQSDISGYPRIALEFDYASGDDDPTDGDNNRFDTLYGVRRGDFGPLGIFGPISRTNIVSPGLRLQFNPASDMTVIATHRAFWLANDRDIWATARLQDATGRSGSYLGQQLEARWRWDVVPKNLCLEIGGAYFLKGSFARDVTNASPDQDSTFFYTQATIKF